MARRSGTAGKNQMVAQIDRKYARISLRKTAVRLLSYALFEGRPLTTRGRWINPLVFANARAIKRRNRSKPAEKPIFIIGTGRSGTTVLGVVMSLHKDIGFLNEPKAMWHSAFPAEDLTGNYTNEPAHYRLNADQAGPDAIRAMHQLHGAYLRATGSVRVLDKYPELIFRVPFVQEIFPDARFLFLVRNGLDTIRSITLWSLRHGAADGENSFDWWGRDKRKWHLMVDQLVCNDELLANAATEIAALTRHKDMAAVEWILSMREGMRLRDECPDVVHEVRYEELVSVPVETLANIFEFCQLPPDAAVFNYAATTLKPADASGDSHELNPSIAAAFRQTMRDLGYRYPVDEGAE